MYFSLNELLGLIETYKYLVLFPLAVFEGPVVTLIAGFLTSINYLDGATAYIVIVIADVIGDALHYLVGYLLRHKKAESLLRFLRIDQAKLLILENHFVKHPKKSILFSKFAPGVGGMVQVVAGVAQMSFFQFVWLSIVGTLPKSLLLVFVGYTFGKYLTQIDSYLSLAGLALGSIAVLLVLVYVGVTRYIEKRI